MCKESVLARTLMLHYVLERATAKDMGRIAALAALVRPDPTHVERDLAFARALVDALVLEARRVLAGSVSSRGPSSVSRQDVICRVGGYGALVAVTTMGDAGSMSRPNGRRGGMAWVADGVERGRLSHLHPVVMRLDRADLRC